jgi:hypothetical protein
VAGRAIEIKRGRRPTTVARRERFRMGGVLTELSVADAGI